MLFVVLPVLHVNVTAFVVSVRLLPEHIEGTAVFCADELSVMLHNSWMMTLPWPGFIEFVFTWLMPLLYDPPPPPVQFPEGDPELEPPPPEKPPPPPQPILSEPPPPPPPNPPSPPSSRPSS